MGHNGSRVYFASAQRNPFQRFLLKNIYFIKIIMTHDNPDTAVRGYLNKSVISLLKG